jgi:hypothetical protein
MGEEGQRNLLHRRPAESIWNGSVVHDFAATQIHAMVRKGETRRYEVRTHRRLVTPRQKPIASVEGDGPERFAYWHVSI